MVKVPGSLIDKEGGRMEALWIHSVWCCACPRTRDRSGCRVDDDPPDHRLRHHLDRAPVPRTGLSHTPCCEDPGSGGCSRRATTRLPRCRRSRNTLFSRDSRCSKARSSAASTGAEAHLVTVDEVMETFGDPGTTGIRFSDAHAHPAVRMAERGPRASSCSIAPGHRDLDRDGPRPAARPGAQRPAPAGPVMLGWRSRAACTSRCTTAAARR